MNTVTLDLERFKELEKIEQDFKDTCKEVVYYKAGEREIITQDKALMILLEEFRRVNDELSLIKSTISYYGMGDKKTFRGEVLSYMKKIRESND